MDRLTFMSDGYYAVSDDNCFDDQDENYCGPAISRLAAYEDTGLEPEEIQGLKNTCDQLSSINDSLFAANQAMGKDLYAYKKAERQGRLVVLPCKIGDKVYIINRHLNAVFESTVISVKVGHYSNNKNYIKTRWDGPNGNASIRKWVFRQIGSYVFLTREEAEAALKGGPHET